MLDHNLLLPIAFRKSARYLSYFCNFFGIGRACNKGCERMVDSMNVWLGGFQIEEVIKKLFMILSLPNHKQVALRKRALQLSRALSRN